MKRNITKFLAALALLVGLTIPMGVWGQTYEEVLTLDCASASAQGTQQLYGTNGTTTMTVAGIKTYLKVAAGATNDIVSGDVTKTGDVYWKKGSGGDGIPDDVLKLGKASGPGGIAFELVDTYDQIQKVSITGYGWKTTTKVAVNGSATQSPSTALTEVTFDYVLSSATRSLSIQVTTSAFCVTEIKLYKEATGGNPTCAIPTFSPAAGTYTEAQTVTISCATENSTIYYTTNGDTPTTSSSVYSEPLAISETTTVKAIAAADGFDNSSIATASYTIKCATPTFSPAAGTYTEAQNVTISCATEGVTIYYTTDGTNPTTESAVYSSALTISETTTLKAMAAKSGLSNSSVAYAEYTINLPYTGADYVRITEMNGLTDGARVIIAARYNATTTSYFAMTAAATGKPAGVSFTSTTSSNGEILPASILDDENTYYWTVNITSDGYTFTNASNQVLGYTSSTNFATGGDNTEWTIVRATAGNSAMVGGYEGFYIVNKNNNGRGIALNNQHNYGPYSTGNNNSSDYNFYLDVFVQGYTPASVATPTFNPASGTEFGNDGIDVTITCATENTTIYYTLDGSDPDDESYQYTEAIHLTATTTIKAIAYDGNDNTSSVATATYTYVDPNTPGTQNNPYTVAQARAAIDAGTGTQGVYATGIVSAIPTAWSNDYNNITFNIVDNSGDQNFLQAFRCVSTDNADASTIAVGDVVVVSGNLKKFNSTYEFDAACQLVSLTHPAVVVEAPTFNPAAGLYTEAQSVTIACATPEAVIYYTIDGTTPSNASTLYENPITVSSTTTIKAIAILGEYNSTVASATYAFLEHAGTETDPYTVADAYAAIDANDGITGVYATGIVSEIVTAYSSQYGNISYNISSDGLTTSDQLQAYRGKSYNGGSFTSEDDIQVGDIVVVYGNLKNYNGTYEFEAANELVSLKRSYTLTINGYASDDTKDGYYLIASPVEVDPATVEGMTSGDFDLYYYDDTQDDEWINYRASETTINHFNLVPGKGYLYAKKATTETPSYSFTLTGAPYAGNGQVPVIAGWNLIGNPFSNEATLNAPFYRMNGDGTGLSAEIESGSTVNAMEGVFVNATATGNVTFSTATAGKGQNIALNVMQGRGTTIDRAIVRFDEGQQLPKFQLFENSTKLFIPQGNQDFAVVRSAAEGEMPVSFRASENGTYTLAVETENMEMDYLHLIDNMTGMDVDLLQTPSYTFEASTRDYANRFRLVFKGNSANEQTTETFAYFNGTSWTVSNQGEATLQVVDVMGRLVSSETINGNATINLNETAGIYMLRLVNGNDVKVQKVVVR